MKRDKSLKTALALMIAVIMTLSLASGTMAKYIHAVKGKDVARVAQFEVGVQSNDDRNGTDDRTSWAVGESTVNLLSTTLDDSGVYNTSAAAFDSNSGVKLVAPGTSGGFQINVSNYSEVAVKTTFSLTETFISDQKIPIVYTYKGQNYSSYGVANQMVGGKIINGGLVELGQAISTEIGNLAPTNGATAASAPAQSITWVWAFEGVDLQTNAKDTALALDSNLSGLDQPTITLSITCTAEQLDTYTAA